MNIRRETDSPADGSILLSHYNGVSVQRQVTRYGVSRETCVFYCFHFRNVSRETLYICLCLTRQHIYVPHGQALVQCAVEGVAEEF